MVEAGDTGTPAAETTTDDKSAMTEKKTLEIADDVRSGLQERFKFFFSNANIRQDNFMRKFLLKNEGMPVDALLRFKTIAKHTTDKDVLLQVAREIEDLVVSDDGKTIGRKVAFTYDNMKEHVPLTLYVSNLAVTKERYDVSTDEFKQLFVKFPGVVMVKLCLKQIFAKGEKLSKDEKPIKQVAHGTALVEFDSAEHLQEAADQILTIKGGVEVEPKVKLELKGRTLKVETLMEHEAKDKEKKIADKNNHVIGDKNDKSEKRKSSQKAPAIEPHYKFDWKPKCVIKIAGLTDLCDRETITEAVCEALDIKLEAMKEKKLYVDYSRGQKDGAIRFEEPSEAIDLVVKKLLSGEVLVGGEKITAELLEGDAEKAYWEKFLAFKNNQLKQRAQERSGRKRQKR